MTERGRLARQLTALLLLAFAILPIANWIPQGHSTDFYPFDLAEWWSGSLIAVGLGVVLALASRRVGGLWRDGRWSGPLGRLDLLAPRRAALVAVVAGVVYAALSRLVLDGRPLLIDEIIEAWQARVYLTGHLSIPSSGHPELTGVMHVVDHAGKVFGQFPAGGPAMLALGALFHAEWLVGPLFAAIGVWWWAAALRRAKEPTVPAAGALLLLAFAPFALFMSASYMNHVTTLMWTLGGIAGLMVVTTSERPRPGIAFALGLAFGIAGTIRPVDALAFGAPAGLWLFVRALKDRTRLGECAVAAVGMGIPLALLLWANARTTGAPLQFGYTMLWGKDHGLGFHPAPWGPPHTPVRGFELINTYLLRLQTNFLETPFPSLLPALAVLALGRRFRPLDRYLAVSGALVVGLYWAYWHNGYYLGPRFFYPLLPILALWTARFGTLLADRWGQGALPHRVWVYTALVGGVIAVTLNIPLRAKQYGNAFLSARHPLEELARTAGVRHALVLVRESWGAQDIARMWGLGVSRAQTEYIYRRSAICEIEETETRLEREGVRDSAAVRQLLAIANDSAGLEGSARFADQTEMYRRGAPYSPLCLRRLSEDLHGGFTPFPPTLLEAASGSAYVRDLHARDTLALAWYPDRPIFLLIPNDTSLGAVPHYHPVRRDSLLADWGLPPTWAPAR